MATERNEQPNLKRNEAGENRRTAEPVTAAGAEPSRFVFAAIDDLRTPRPRPTWPPTIALVVMTFGALILGAVALPTSDTHHVHSRTPVAAIAPAVDARAASQPLPSVPATARENLLRIAGAEAPPLPDARGVGGSRSGGRSRAFRRKPPVASGRRRTSLPGYTHGSLAPPLSAADGNITVALSSARAALAAGVPEAELLKFSWALERVQSHAHRTVWTTQQRVARDGMFFVPLFDLPSCARGELRPVRVTISRTADALDPKFVLFEGVPSGAIPCGSTTASPSQSAATTPPPYLRLIPATSLDHWQRARLQTVRVALFDSAHHPALFNAHGQFAEKQEERNAMAPRVNATPEVKETLFAVLGEKITATIAAASDGSSGEEKVEQLGKLYRTREWVAALKPAGSRTSALEGNGNGGRALAAVSGGSSTPARPNRGKGSSADPHPQ